MHLSHLTSDDRPWTIEDARLRIHTLGLGEDTGHASDNEISSASKVLRELNLFEKERVWKLRDMWRLQHGQAGRVKDGDGVRQGFNPGESFDEPSVTESCPAPVQKNYLSYILHTMRHFERTGSTCRRTQALSYLWRPSTTRTP